MELEVLWHAWDTGTAHFYRMINQEHKDWYAGYQDATSSSLRLQGRVNELGGKGSRPAEGKPPGSQDGLRVDVPSRMPAAALSDSSNYIVMSVTTGENGANVAAKHIHKVRSGKACKKKSTVPENRAAADWFCS